MPISVVINTYNAQEHLSEVLEAVKEFDEIVICDMESTDDTLQIARNYGCKIVTFPKGECTIVEPARNFAIQQASSEWVLVVDADEIITPQLRKYLYARIADPNCPKGIFISRVNMYLGKFLKDRSHNYLLRFVSRNHTDWPVTIHAIPKIDGNTEHAPAKYCMYHLSDMSLRQYVHKMNDYTDNEVVRKAKKNYGIGALIYRPLWRFIRVYFIEGYCLSGKRGLIKACMTGVYQTITIAKILEKKLRDELEKEK